MPTETGSEITASTDGPESCISRSTHPRARTAIAAADVPWHLLSEEAKETLQTIWLPLLEGYSKDEVAASIGRPRRYLNRRLAEFEAELRQLVGMER